MPEKFTFPTIEQAMSLQSAENMEQIKVSLRNWFNQNSLRISQNVAWSFKLLNSECLLRRYIHCKFCQAKLIYIKQVGNVSDNKSSSFKLSKFYLHHDHRLIESVKQKGKMKTFPQNYVKVPEHSKHSIERQRRQRSEKLRKRRVEINKYKKLELYYRLNLSVKQCDKSIVNIKDFAAKTLGVTQQRFMSFLNSNTRGTIEVAAIKKLLKRAGFQKYNVELDNTNSLKYHKAKIQDSVNLPEINSEEQETEEKTKNKNQSLIIEQSKEYFKDLMIFVNYNESTKKNLERIQGLINISLLENKIISKKFMSNMKWDTLLLYSHDENFIPNRLYAIIMIDSSRFNIRQIKKCFEISFKLLNPLKKLNFQCCIHQQNIYIMGALDLIIEESGQRQESSQNLPTVLSYFLSPKLSADIINKCEFIPKIFRKKLIDKIFELDPKEIDAEFQKIITELQKASQIEQYKVKTQEYLAQLKQFYENFHKIFLGKFASPSFVSLIFANYKHLQDTFDTSMDDILSKSLQQYSQGNKYFFEYLIQIFEVFHIPGGSFIYKKHEGQMRQSTKVESIYANYLIMSEPQLFDEIKRFYNAKTFKGKYQKLKPTETKKENADFFDEFSAILYERVYKIRQIFMKVTPEVMTVLVKEIQKSFTLQVQTRTIQQIKKDGIIKAKQLTRQPNTIKVLDRTRFWPTDKQKKLLQQSKNKTISLVELEASVIELEKSEKDKPQLALKGSQKQKSKRASKKLWQCDCNWSRFTFLPCCHEIRCCLTFFTSLEDQIDDFWLFNPKNLQRFEDDDNKSDILTEDEEANNQNSQKQGENNSESD